MSASFWNMGGYAIYVWASYGSAAAVLAWNVLAVRLRRREVLHKLAEGANGHD